MSLCCPACKTCIAYTLWHRRRQSIRLTIEGQQILARARARVELVAAVLDGLVRKRRQNGFGNAPVAQPRFDRDLAVELADPLCSFATAKQRREMEDSIRHGRAVVFENRR